MGSAIVNRIRSKGLEYTSKQYQSQHNNQYLQDTALKTHLFKRTLYVLCLMNTMMQKRLERHHMVESGAIKIVIIISIACPCAISS